MFTSNTNMISFWPCRHK